MYQGSWWWSGTASIRRPPVFQTGALPTELPDLLTRSSLIRLAGATGFEPATFGLTGRRTLQAVLRPLGMAQATWLRPTDYTGKGGLSNMGWYQNVRSRTRFGPGHDLPEVWVRSAPEIEAAAPAPGVDRPVVRRARPAAEADPLGLDPTEDGVELVLADQERVVHAVDIVCRGEVQRELVVDPDRCEVPGPSYGRSNIRAKKRADWSLSWDGTMVWSSGDGHRCLQTPCEMPGRTNGRPDQSVWRLDCGLRAALRRSSIRRRPASAGCDPVVPDDEKGSYEEAHGSDERPPVDQGEVQRLAGGRQDDRPDR